MGKKNKTPKRISEKRKELNASTSKAGRDEETELFNKMFRLLPLQEKFDRRLDKNTILRLSLSFIKTRRIIELINVPSEEKTIHGIRFDSLEDSKKCIKAMNGFLMVLAMDGNMVYLSENVDKYLGVSRIDIMGDIIFDFSHPNDGGAIKEILKIKNKFESKVDGVEAESHERIPCEFILRMKCTLTSKGTISFKPAPYKVIYFTGHIIPLKKAINDFKDRKQPALEKNSAKCFIAVLGEPLEYPDTSGMPLNKGVFVTKHSLDMKYIRVDQEVEDILGYTKDDLEGNSFYNYVHALDLQQLDKFLKTLYEMNASVSGYYRYLAKSGGYIWVLTQGRIVTDPKSAQAKFIVLINHVITETQSGTQISSLEQLLNKNNIQNYEQQDDTEGVSTLNAEQLFRVLASSESDFFDFDQLFSK